LPGFRFHALVGRDKGRYAVSARETGALRSAGSKAMPSTSIWKTITEERFMTRKLPKQGLPPMHPGELLGEEILPALDRPKTEIARLLVVSRQTLYDVLKERQPVTLGMALRLGKLCGNGPDLWLNLQKRYDLHQAQQELGALQRRRAETCRAGCRCAGAGRGRGREAEPSLVGFAFGGRISESLIRRHRDKAVGYAFG